MTPVLSTADADALQYELPCGLRLEFLDVSNRAMTPSQFAALGITLADFVFAAGLYATTYIEWAPIAEGVFRNNDGCWPELVCAPPTFVEHNEVPGRPVLYVVSESSSIFTGTGSPEGLAQIRKAAEGGLARCALVLENDRRTWTPFDA